MRRWLIAAALWMAAASSMAACPAWSLQRAEQGDRPPQSANCRLERGLLAAGQQRGQRRGLRHALGPVGAVAALLR